MNQKQIDTANQLKNFFKLAKLTTYFKDILCDSEPLDGEAEMINIWDKALEELEKNEVDFDKIDSLLAQMEAQADINKKTNK